MNPWAIRNMIKSGKCKSAKQRGYLTSIIHDEGVYVGGSSRPLVGGVEAEKQKQRCPQFPMSNKDMSLFMKRYKEAKTHKERRDAINSFPEIKGRSLGWASSILKLFREV